MDRRIVATGFDGGVRVTDPAKEIHAVMTRGGGWFDRNEMTIQRAMKYEIDKQVNNGRDPRVVKRHIHALAFGGMTDAEFFELIRDRDAAPFGTGCELWHVDELPTDRWFRHAWRRSPNGGPISIDLEKAKLIQIEMIDKRINQMNRREEGALMKFMVPQVKKLRFNLRAMARKIGEARDEYEVRSVWPDAFVR